MPNFRIININTSLLPQQWQSFLDGVEHAHFDLAAGGVRGNDPDDVWPIEENFSMGYAVEQNGEEVNTELRYTLATNAWALHPEMNPFVLNVAAPAEGIRNVTLSCGEILP